MDGWSAALRELLANPAALTGAADLAGALCRPGRDTDAAADLIRALRPMLSPEGQARLDRAAETVRLAQTAAALLGGGRTP